MSKKFNKLFAPIVIAGITVGFLASAYRFVFANSKATENNRLNTPSIDDVVTDPTTQMIDSSDTNAQRPS